MTRGTTPVPKPKRHKSEALTEFACGRDCTVRSRRCDRDPEKSVFAHLRGVWALGNSTKPGDHFGVIACQSCHDAMDGRIGIPGEVSDYDRLRALYETQYQMIEAGLIVIKGA